MEQINKTRVTGKITGAILGGFLSGSFFGIVLGALFGHFLFDLKDDLLAGPAQIPDEHNHGENSVLLHAVIRLGLHIFRLKENVQLPRLDFIKEYCVEQFKFDLNDINRIDSIVYMLINNEENDIDKRKCTSIINYYTTQEEREKIIELFFLLASYQSPMLVEQEVYIHSIAEDIKISGPVYTDLRDRYYDQLAEDLKILGLCPGCSAEQIKTAYGNLMAELQPDVQDPGSDRKKFQQVLNAYKKIKRIQEIN